MVCLPVAPSIMMLSPPRAPNAALHVQHTVSPSLLCVSLCRQIMPGSASGKALYTVQQQQQPAALLLAVQQQQALTLHLQHCTKTPGTSA